MTLEGDLVDAVGALKDGPGGDTMTTGSPGLVGSLLAFGLVDELRLLIYPVVLGTGKRLFPEGAQPLTLEITDSAVFANGVTYLSYRPRAPAKSRVAVCL